MVWRHPQQLRNVIALFVLGTINNLTYVVVISAASNIVNQFNCKNLIGLIPLANIILGLVSKAVNSLFTDKVPYWSRLVAGGFLSIGGCVLVAFAPAFWVALVGILFVGTFSAFCESVFLGFLSLYPPGHVGGWSSGTGFAGVFGSAYYLILSSVLEIQDKWIFLSQIPFVFIYLFFFFCVLAKPVPYVPSEDEDEEDVEEGEAAGLRGKKGAESVSARGRHLPLGPDRKSSAGGGLVINREEQEVEAEGADQGNGSVPPEERRHLLGADGAPAEAHRAEIVHKRPVITWSDIKICFPLISWLALQLGLVYFFEYVVSVGAADKANPSDDDSLPFEKKNAYVILSFCYQVGVLLSRSSLHLFKIRRVGWLTNLQGLNFILWIFIAKYRFVTVWVQFPLMVFVGLLGGASYVNCFYWVLHDKKIQDYHRDLCMNLCSFCTNTGILMASLFDLFMDHTFLS